MSNDSLGADHWLEVMRRDEVLAEFWWRRAFDPEYKHEQDTLEAEAHNRQNARDYMARATMAATLYLAERKADEG